MPNDTVAPSRSAIGRPDARQQLQVDSDLTSIGLTLSDMLIDTHDPPHRRAAAAVIATLLLAAGITQARGAERGTPEEQAACTPDVFTLCTGDIPDESAIVACLRRNTTRLQVACRRVIAPETMARSTAR